MSAPHADTTTAHGNWQRFDHPENESECRLGQCYLGMAIGLPLSLAIWAGLIVLVYKLLP